MARGYRRRIPTFDLAKLHDDRGFFPPYDAAPVIRTALRIDHPDAIEVLERRAGRIDMAAIQDMNRQVDQGQRSAASVATDFLVREGFLDRAPAQ